MGLMDRVRAQATQLAQQAQEAAQEGRARLDQAQAARRGDMLLRQLGALVFAERTGRGTADSQSRIDQLISDISAHESQNGLNLAGEPAAGQPQTGQPSAEQPQTGQPSAEQPQTGQPPTGQTAPPTSSASAMPPVDTTTNFFPAPDDDASSAPPQG